MNFVFHKEEKISFENLDLLMSHLNAFGSIESKIDLLNSTLDSSESFIASHIYID